jgi:polyhydroxyalkanoate synthesis regulator phasin
MVSTRELEQYLAEHKLPTREDIKKLLAELEALENRLDQMEK